MTLEILFSAGAAVAMSYFLCVVFTEQQSSPRRIGVLCDRMGSPQLSIARRAAEDGSTDVDPYGTYQTRDLAIEKVDR
jgi:hypothetical protein